MEHPVDKARERALTRYKQSVDEVDPIMIKALNSYCDNLKSEFITKDVRLKSQKVAMVIFLVAILLGLISIILSI